MVAGGVQHEGPQVVFQLCLQRAQVGRLAGSDRAVGPSNQVGQTHDHRFQVANAVLQGRNLHEKAHQAVPAQSGCLVRDLQDGLAQRLACQPLAPDVFEKLLGQLSLEAAPLEVGLGDRDEHLDDQPLVQVFHQLDKLVRRLRNQLCMTLDTELARGPIEPLAVAERLAELSQQQRGFRLCHARFLFRGCDSGCPGKCQLPRSAGNRGARSIARTATRLVNRPTAKTTANMIPSSRNGIEALPKHMCGNTAHSAARTPTPKPPHRRNTFSSTTMCAKRLRPKPTACSRANSARRSTTLRNWTVANPNVPSSSPKAPRLWNVLR